MHGDSGSGRAIDASGVQLPGVLDDVFAYDGSLGPLFTRENTKLHLWAPTAQVCFLSLIIRFKDLRVSVSVGRSLSGDEKPAPFRSPASDFQQSRLLELMKACYQQESCSAICFDHGGYRMFVWCCIQNPPVENRSRLFRWQRTTECGQFLAHPTGRGCTTFSR